MAARRRKGNPVDGWLLIDKPEGVTSTQVVAKARWALRAQKAGHAGTLDPLATGLLAVAFGEATKTVPVAQEGLKTYRFTLRLGQRTETDDAEGAVTAESADRPSDAAIAAALPAFEGEIAQVPPQFSAIKVAGERAYDIARDGETVALEARPVWVERLALVARPDADHAVLDMVCGKGGYVRSIARDLGEALGCHGHVATLRRRASGAFSVETALPMDALDAVREGTLAAPLLPLEAGLADLPEVRVTAASAAALRQGREVATTARLEFGADAWASHAGQAVALVRHRAGKLKPERVFLGSGAG
ncbi:MAG: tRNA pseudouridine(55) synthase TruB [Paracoccaceae bacterium]